MSYAIVVAGNPYKYVSELEERGRAIVGYTLALEKADALVFGLRRVFAIIKELRVLEPSLLWSAVEVAR